MDRVSRTRKNELNAGTGYINRLTLEVLTVIFSYLPLSERKNTRLVCRQWSEANNVKRFLSKEKLLCNSFYDLDIIFETLQNSGRKILNLEFYNFEFNNFLRSQKFWKMCGRKIESLLFSNCALTEETMNKVMRYCVQLKSLTLEDLPPRPRKGASYPQITCFEASSPRASLRSFKLSVSSIDQISNDFLGSLTEIFPNMKEFKFHSVQPIDDEEFFVESKDSSKCTNLGFMELLYELDGIESIEINEANEFNLLFNISEHFMLSTYLPELKEVKFGQFYCGGEGIVGENFFKLHNQLLSIHYIIQICKDISMTAAEKHTARLIACLLDSCPTLQKLEIFLYNDDEESCPQCLSLDASTSAKLVKCGLQKLTVNFNLEISLPSNNKEIVNNTLESLEIYCPLKNGFFLSLCRTFRGLKHLMVTYMNDDSLQCIWQYQENLTSLQLINFQNCTDYGFIGSPTNVDEENTNQSKRYSIREMQRLKYLELSMCACHDGHEPKITKKTFQELKFPNLLYLRVGLNAPWELSTDLVKAFSNCTNLEGLNCIFYKEEPIEYAVLSELCSKLPKLKFINILFEEFEDFGDRNYERLFKVCPKLRVLETRLYLYYYDIMKKRVAKISSRKKYPMGPRDAYPHFFV